MILLIDNYDSFTYNLYQYIGIFSDDILVVRKDKITVPEIRESHPERIVLSPGPKTPAEAGICVDVVQAFYRELPILGICLGHQSIGAAFGGTISYAKELFNGKRSLIRHAGTGIFEGV
ncbi:MAG: gamma-glutamyl-gamma-aminobutyrate hydrolase family protein, partial [Lachnospiraceae bacterium]|nr:gamma-glutamyl-gamma-aminobutyrate hydrolase family protein [Lachnospiraceae bacterium]